jgi:hypothetical protein
VAGERLGQRRARQSHLWLARTQAPADLPLRGDQADVLRAVGWWLDEQEASGIQITNYGAYLGVSWESARAGAHQRAYQEYELRTLQLQARRLRQGAPAASGSSHASGELAELLRTLGGELDQAKVELARIVQEPSGFRVTGMAGSAPYHELYATDILQTRSAQRRAARGTGGATAADRLLDGIVGLPAVTRDRQRLGLVAEVRHDELKVRTPRFQRDYWLPMSSVATVVPDEELVLDFLKSELVEYQHARAAASPERSALAEALEPVGQRREPNRADMAPA